MRKTWPRKPLRQVADVLMGQSPPGSSYNTDGEGEALLNGPTEFGERYPKTVQWTTAGTRFCEEGDILYCVRGSTTGRMNWADRRYCIGRGLAAIRAKPDECETAYLSLALTHLAAEVIHQTDDGVFPNLDRDGLLDFEMPVPKPAEQRRLVARIEALTAHLEQARQARQAALGEAKHMLAAAVSSMLKRRKHSSVPLQQLLLEQPRNGWSPPAIYQTGDGTPVLTLSSVTGFLYDGSRVKLTSAPIREGAHYWLQRDELLITRSNTPELVGHAAIYDGTPAKAICCDLIMKMKVNPAKADVRFVHYCLRSPDARQFITQRAKGASGTMQKIAKQDVQEIPIPEIPVAEQRRIVARLDALSAKQTELRRLQTETETELAAFTPALLAKAFKGEL